MRKLMSLVTMLVIAALGWGAYWYLGATTLERELGNWLNTRRANGWTAEAAVDTRGFPNRFDTSFEGLTLTDPGTGVSWQAPLFQTLQLSYKPTHVIAVWPDVQHVTLPGRSLDITSDRLLGSFEFAAHPDLPLSAVTVEAAGARFVSEPGGETKMEAGQLSMRPSPGADDPGSYDLFVSASNIAPPEALLSELGAAIELPPSIAHLQVDARVSFDKPWDRSAIETARPQPRQIALKGASVGWGSLALEATGTLEVSATGMPSGTLDAVATNWRGIVAVLEASGKIDPAYVGTLTRGLELLAGFKGNPDTLDIPLSFSRGTMSLGSVAIGPAPIIALP